MTSSWLRTGKKFAVLSLLILLPGVADRAYAQGGRLTPQQEAWLRATYLNYTPEWNGAVTNSTSWTNWWKSNSNAWYSLLASTGKWDTAALWIFDHTNSWESISNSARYASNAVDALLPFTNMARYASNTVDALLPFTGNWQNAYVYSTNAPYVLISATQETYRVITNITASATAFTSHTGAVGTAVHGLGTASTHGHEEYATAAQGVAGTNALWDAVTNWSYPLSNPSNYVTQSVTNGLVDASVTNGLASLTDLGVRGATNIVNGTATSYDSSTRTLTISTNDFGGLSASATNNTWIGLTNWATGEFYPLSNPSNYVTEAITNWLTVTESDPLWSVWRTNTAAGTTNAVLPDGSLYDISSLLGGSSFDPDATNQAVITATNLSWQLVLSETNSWPFGGVGGGSPTNQFGDQTFTNAPLNIQGRDQILTTNEGGTQFIENAYGVAYVSNAATAGFGITNVTGPGMTTDGGAVTFSTNGWSFGGGAVDWQGGNVTNNISVSNAAPAYSLILPNGHTAVSDYSMTSNIYRLAVQVDVSPVTVSNYAVRGKSQSYGQAFDLGHAPSLAFNTGEWTMAFWLRAPVSATGSGVPFGRGLYENNGWYMYFTASYVAIAQQRSGAYYLWGVSNWNSSGAWTHFAFVRTGPSTGYIYQDGTNCVTFGTPSNTTYSSIEHMTIGGNAGNQGMTNDVDEIAMWDRALTAGEVATLAAGNGLWINPSSVFPSSGNLMSLNLQGLWHLDEGTGTTTADASGNGLTGTMLGGGMTWITGKPVPSITIQTAYPIMGRNSGTAAQKGVWYFGEETGETFLRGTTTDTSSNGLRFPVRGDDPAVFLGGAQLYSKAYGSTNSLYVEDSIGNVTRLGSHDGPLHVIDSYNRFTGTGRTIDMDALGMLLQALIDGGDMRSAIQYVRGAGATNIYHTYTVPRINWDSEEDAKWRANTNYVKRVKPDWIK